jgi:DNA-binding IclR family transcriptional regulator
MTVRQTSIESYYMNEESGLHGDQADRVLRFITWAQRNGWPNLSRREIATATGIETSAIPRAVLDLVKAELVVEDEKRPCTLTGRLVNTVRLAPAQGELSL